MGKYDKQKLEDFTRIVFEKAGEGRVAALVPMNNNVYRVIWEVERDGQEVILSRKFEASFLTSCERFDYLAQSVVDAWRRDLQDF